MKNGGPGMQEYDAWYDEWRDAADAANLNVMFPSAQYDRSTACKKEMAYIRNHRRNGTEVGTRTMCVVVSRAAPRSPEAVEH